VRPRAGFGDEFVSEDRVGWFFEACEMSGSVRSPYFEQRKKKSREITELVVYEWRN
jgi:hypothetical protein